jgi:hypothetical protein
VRRRFVPPKQTSVTNVLSTLTSLRGKAYPYGVSKFLTS